LSRSNIGIAIIGGIAATAIITAGGVMVVGIAAGGGNERSMSALLTE